MVNYRRLISYIYAYEGSAKGKNIGFAKLETRSGQCRLNVNVKKVYSGGSDLGCICWRLIKRFFWVIFYSQWSGRVQSCDSDGKYWRIWLCYGNLLWPFHP